MSIELTTIATGISNAGALGLDWVNSRAQIPKLTTKARNWPETDSTYTLVEVRNPRNFPIIITYCELTGPLGPMNAIGWAQGYSINSECHKFTQGPIHLPAHSVFKLLFPNEAKASEGIRNYADGKHSINVYSAVRDKPYHVGIPRRKV